jgi:AraC-like DNA-binding protein
MATSPAYPARLTAPHPKIAIAQILSDQMTNLPDTYFFQHSYCDFDQLVADVRQWDLDFRQIDRGLFRGEVLQFGMAGIHISEGRFGRALDQRGAPPAGLRTIGIPANRKVNFIWRGQQISGNNLIVFPRGAELASVSTPEFHIYTCSFPEDLLALLSEELEIGELDQLRGGHEVIHCDSDLMNRLQRHIRALCGSVRREKMSLCHQNTQHQIRFAFPRQLLRTIAASEGVCVPATSQKRELAVTRALAYIERHARGPLSIKSLCVAAGVSQRTLEYAFEERFGVTPKALLLTHRLNMVRRELRDSDHSTTKVVDVANDYGFWHMGRFAANYRQLFEELPSETLQRTSPVLADSSFGQRKS